MAFATLALLVAACVEPDIPTPTPDPGPDPGPGPNPGPVVSIFDVTVQLSSDGSNLNIAGINVSLVDASGVATYDATTNENGTVTFQVPAGTYSASATYKTVEDGKRITFNGSNASIAVNESGTFSINMNKVVSSQIIVKELYFGGCQKSDGSGSYHDDAYVILYNNSEYEADASDIVISLVLPGNGHANNKYVTDGKLLYEDLGWIPAYSAIWWFTSEVKIPAYSQIVIAVYGAIDHTQTVPDAVDLSKPEYYWMSNTEIKTIFKNAKYSASEAIPTDHYMTTVPVSPGNAWVMSFNSPAFYIGKMDKATALALSNDKDNFDKTATLTVAKFPQDKVLDAVEVFDAGNIAKSNFRFPASINTGYISHTGDQGHTVYRNVDKEATLALPENEGKIEYMYAEGTYNATNNTGSTDFSGIDAEASIANGAHIIYSDTNDSGKDFHERMTSSLKYKKPR